MSVRGQLTVCSIKLTCLEPIKRGNVTSMRLQKLSNNLRVLTIYGGQKDLIEGQRHSWHRDGRDQLQHRQRTLWYEIR